MMSGDCKERSRALRPAVATAGWLAAAALAASALAGCTIGSPAGGTARGLEGRIWAPAHDRFVSVAEVEHAVGRARFVLLGEIHTVARQHELQARMIRVAARHRRPVVVLEMVPRSRQDDIDAWRAAPRPTPEGFARAVDWTARGWPDFAMYAPIVRAALDGGLPIGGGDSDPGTIRTVGRDGLDALAAGRRSRLALDRSLPQAARKRLVETLRRAHCGVDTHAPIDRMVAVQRLRDASMADRLLAADTGDGAVLISGAGHVRRDHGVPWYLHARRPNASVVSIAFLGTRGIGETIAAQRQAAGGSLPFDFVWFTAGGAPAPPCADHEDTAS